jgi:hypothetical protein
VRSRLCRPAWEAGPAAVPDSLVVARHEFAPDHHRAVREGAFGTHAIPVARHPDVGGAAGRGELEVVHVQFVGIDVSGPARRVDVHVLPDVGEGSVDADSEILEGRVLVGGKRRDRDAGVVLLAVVVVVVVAARVGEVAASVGHRQFVREGVVMNPP